MWLEMTARNSERLALVETNTRNHIHWGAGRTTWPLLQGGFPWTHFALPWRHQWSSYGHHEGRVVVSVYYRWQIHDSKHLPLAVVCGDKACHAQFSLSAWNAIGYDVHKWPDTLHSPTTILFIILKVAMPTVNKNTHLTAPSFPRISRKPWLLWPASP